MLDLLQHWRRDFHRFPETAWTEYRTTSLIAAELAKEGYQILLGDQIFSASAVMGRQIDEVAEKQRAMSQGADPHWLEPQRLTGLIALLDTGRPGPCVAR